MAKYRLLADHYAGGALLQAGSTIVEGVDVPTGWAPTPYTEPLDQDAANKFFAQGVKLPGLLRPQFVGVSIPPPTCKWIPNPNPTGGPLNPYREWILAGPLGVGLGSQQIGVVGTGQAA
jgi:hypothetical protein